MTTINLDFILEDHKRIAILINELGEILLRENEIFYQEIILTNFNCSKLNPKEEKDYLHKLYKHIIDKLKEIKF